MDPIVILLVGFIAGGLAGFFGSLGVLRFMLDAFVESVRAEVRAAAGYPNGHVRQTPDTRTMWSGD